MLSSTRPRSPQQPDRASRIFASRRGIILCAFAAPTAVDIACFPRIFLQHFVMSCSVCQLVPTRYQLHCPAASTGVSRHQRSPTAQSFPSRELTFSVAHRPRSIGHEEEGCAKWSVHDRLLRLIRIAPDRGVFCARRIPLDCHILRADTSVLSALQRF